MNGWDNVYNSGFFIDTKEPSKIVELGLNNIPENSKILDLGCGNGRNAIYAAHRGHTVDAVDLVCLDFLEDTFLEIRNRIHFYKKSVWDFHIQEKLYNGIIMTRFIQYFSPDELPELFEYTINGLSNTGLLMLSYTASGGIPQEILKTNKFKHRIERVSELLNKKHMRITHLEKGAGVSTHVHYSFPAETYDILAVRQL